jgi:hypothetical protein
MGQCAHRAKVHGYPYCIFLWKDENAGGEENGDGSVEPMTIGRKVDKCMFEEVVGHAFCGDAYLLEHV